MKGNKQIARKAAPMIAAAAALVTAGGCATEESSYSPELAPVGPPATESAPAPVTETPQQDMDCFLTTACTQAMGLPDDCRELTALRRFRDDHLMATPGGRAEVSRYHRIAPRIVSAIGRTTAPRAENMKIYRSLVQPTVALIEAGRFGAAFEHYRRTVLALAQRLGVDAD